MDGTATDLLRVGIDEELSHWIPNRTREIYKAGTSTEICFKYLVSHPTTYDLVVNNHLDIDGLLSVFALTHPKMALSHRPILCAAAAAGDFWAWAEGKALKLCQELTLFFRSLKPLKIDIQDAYKKCFELILTILQHEDGSTEAQGILATQATLVETGEIMRTVLNQRLVHYHVPKEITSGQIQKFLEVPGFNDPITPQLAFWPQVRNRWDQEKIHLVSTESDAGIYYDLWFPGYSWADTEGLWHPPGLTFPTQTENFYSLDWHSLTQIGEALNHQETGHCRWEVFPGFYFATPSNPRNFPIVMTTLNEKGQQAPSLLSLEIVKNKFSAMSTDFVTERMAGSLKSQILLHDDFDVLPAETLSQFQEDPKP